MNRLSPIGMGLLAGVLVVAGGCSDDNAATRGSATTVPKATATTSAGAPAGGSGTGPPAPGTAVPAPALPGAGASSGGSAGAAVAAAAAAAELGKTVVVASVPTAAPRGQVVTASFRTRPGSTCQLDVRYAIGPGLDNQRQPPATANANGDVSWTWTVSGSAQPGEASADVVCSGGAKGGATITIS